MLTVPSTTAATSTYGGQHHRHSCAAVSSSGASAATRASASSFQATARHQHSSPSARRLPAGNCSPPIHIAFVPIDVRVLLVVFLACRSSLLATC
jgi:hypothetical protein